MTVSKLATTKILSPNHSGQRTQKVCKITPHHMAGKLTVEQCGNVFLPRSRQASSNYGIGSDGRIACYVEEQNRAWTSSSAWNDNRAITIEVANSSTGGEWPVSDKAWASLVALCVDICKRYNFRLDYTGDKNGSLTEHQMFASTNCPGPYLHKRMSQLAKEVNAQLDGKTPAKTTTSKATTSKTTTKTTTSKTASSSDFTGGKYRVNVGVLNVRSAPSLSGAVVAQYKQGQTVNLDNWYKIADGYVWARYTAYSGKVRYVAVGKATGKAEANDYLIKA